MFRSEDIDLDKIIGNVVVKLLEANELISLDTLLSELEKSLNQSSCQMSRNQYLLAIDHLTKRQKEQQEETQPEEKSNVVGFVNRKGDPN